MIRKDYIVMFYLLDYICLNNDVIDRSHLLYKLFEEAEIMRRTAKKNISPVDYIFV
jgi:hypothetical protein